MKTSLENLEYQKIELMNNILRMEEFLESEDADDLNDNQRIYQEREVNRMYYQLEMLDKEIEKAKE